MNQSVFHKIQSIVLITALAFGQVGVGFFHNKHDAHESVIDLDRTVLVKHGEHCKVCAVDLAHQVIAPDLDIQLAEIASSTPVAFDYISSTLFSRPLTKDRAPPAFA